MDAGNPVLEPIIQSLKELFMPRHEVDAGRSGGDDALSIWRPGAGLQNGIDMQRCYALPIAGAPDLQGPISRCGNDEGSITINSTPIDRCPVPDQGLRMFIASGVPDLQC